jgi:hypothetical protein
VQVLQHPDVLVLKKTQIMEIMKQVKMKILIIIATTIVRMELEIEAGSHSLR